MRWTTDRWLTFNVRSKVPFQFTWTERSPLNGAYRPMDGCSTDVKNGAAAFNGEMIGQKARNQMDCSSDFAATAKELKNVKPIKELA